MNRTFPYRRVLTVGSPGAGKSTFARSLAAVTGLPLVHLDLLFWNPDRTTVSPAVFDARLAAAMASECWIIDGNYSRTQDVRMDAADLVFFFDMPTEVCLSGVAARRGKPRPDLPWIEGENGDDAADEEFLCFIRTFRGDGREHILSRLAARPRLPVVTFHTHAEANAYLQSLRS